MLNSRRGAHARIGSSPPALEDRVGFLPLGIEIRMMSSEMSYPNNSADLAGGVRQPFFAVSRSPPSPLAYRSSPSKGLPPRLRPGEVLSRAQSNQESASMIIASDLADTHWWPVYRRMRSRAACGGLFRAGTPLPAGTPIDSESRLHTSKLRSRFRTQYMSEY